MPFAAALSEHPVSSLAAGEVIGSVLEDLGVRPDLVVLTVTRPHLGALDDIAAAVDAVLHPLVSIGCAAESVVGSRCEVEESPSISLWAGRLGPLLPTTLGATQRADGTWSFAGWPAELSFDPTALLLVADPFTFPAGDFLSWLEVRHPGLPVVGGYASAALGPGGNRLVIGGGTVGVGAVGALIGPGADVDTVVSQGARPYGDPLTVTRSDRHLLQEVAGVPALECLVQQISRALTPTEVAGLDSAGVQVGRVIDNRIGEPGPGDFLIRSILGVDRISGAIAVDDRVPLGSTVQFHLRDAVTASRDLQGLLVGREAEGVLLFPCNGRGTRLFDKTDHDAGIVADFLGPVATGGFFAAGEFGPVGGTNFVHNFAASMALFRDR